MISWINQGLIVKKKSSKTFGMLALIKWYFAGSTLHIVEGELKSWDWTKEGLMGYSNGSFETKLFAYHMTLFTEKKQARSNSKKAS